MAGRIIRFLTLALNYQDAGVTTGLASVDKRAAGVQQRFRGISSDVRKSQLSIITLGFIAGAALRGLAVDAAEYHKEILFASFATGELDRNVQALDASAKQLSRSMALAPVEAAKLTKAVTRLGITQQRFGEQGAQAMIDSLTRTSTAFAKLTDEDAEEMSKTFFRLGMFVTDTDKELGEFIQTIDLAASAMLRIGDMTAAGAGELAQFMKKFQSLGQMVNIQTPELIALAGAFANIDPTSPERPTTSVMRLFSKEFSENQKEIARFMNLSNEAFTEMRVNDPIGFIQLLTSELKEANREVTLGLRDLESVGGIMTALGFSNFRDQRTLATLIASLNLLPQLVSAANEEYAQGGEITDRWALFQQLLRFRIDELGQSFKGAGQNISGTLMPALTMTLGTLTELFDLIQRNRFVAGALGIGLGVGVLNLARSAAAWLLPLFMLGRGGRGGPGVAQGGLAGVPLMGRPQGGMIAGRTLTQAQSQAMMRAGMFPGVSPVDAALMGAMLAPKTPLRHRMAQGRIAQFFAGRAAAMGLLGAGAGSLPGVARGAGAGRAAQLGAGGLGLLFGARATGFVGRMAGRGALARGGLAAAGIGGPIGLVLALGPLLGSLSGRLGEMARVASQDAGPGLGILLESLRLLFNVVELGGRGIGWLTDQLGKLVALIFEIPIIGDIAEGIRGGAGKLNDTLDRWNEHLGREDRGRTELAMTAEISGTSAEVQMSNARVVRGGAGPGSSGGGTFFG